MPPDAANDLLPPDRADQDPVSLAMADLLRALETPRRDKWDRPCIEVTVDEASWAKLRTYFARPYRPKPSTFGLSLAGGMVWFSPAGRESDVASEAEVAAVPMPKPVGGTVSWLPPPISPDAAPTATRPESAIYDGPALGDAAYVGAWKESK